MPVIEIINKATPWKQYLKAYRDKHKNLSLKDAMKGASPGYNKQKAKK